MHFSRPRSESLIRRTSLEESERPSSRQKLVQKHKDEALVSRPSACDGDWISRFMILMGFFLDQWAHFCFTAAAGNVSVRHHVVFISNWREPFEWSQLKGFEQNYVLKANTFLFPPVVTLSIRSDWVQVLQSRNKKSVRRIQVLFGINLRRRFAQWWIKYSDPIISILSNR